MIALIPALLLPLAYVPLRPKELLYRGFQTHGSTITVQQGRGREWILGSGVDGRWVAERLKGPGTNWDIAEMARPSVGMFVYLFVCFVAFVFLSGQWRG